MSFRNLFKVKTGKWSMFLGYLGTFVCMQKHEVFWNIFLSTVDNLRLKIIQSDSELVSLDFNFFLCLLQIKAKYGFS